MTVLAQLFIAVSLAMLVACSPALFNIDTPPQDTSDGALREEIRINWEREVSHRINDHEERLDVLEERCPTPGSPVEKTQALGPSKR